MKFKDIPQLTGDGKYKVDYEMRSIVRAIEDYIREDGLQLVPDFQRGHVWTEQQQINYIEFILRGGKTGRDFYFNHPQWMGSFKEGRMGFVCVDGLQRITALMRFVHNEIKAFGYYCSEYEDGLRQATGRFTVHINDLKTQREVLQWYLEMNSGGTPHSPEELNRIRSMITPR